MRSVVEGQPVVFPLQTARSSDVWAAIAFLLVLPWAVLASGAVLVILPKIFVSWSALIGVAALVPLAAALGWIAYRTFLEAFPGRRYLGLTSNALVLQHSLLLRQRLEIPLSDVDRVAVRSATSPGFWEAQSFTLEKENRGLTWTASDRETVDALDLTTSFFLPLASHVQTDEPNVAVVLRQTIDLAELRRKPISSSDLYCRRICDVERAPGFLVRVADPVAAQRAFEERGLLGKLAEEHSRLIEPTEDDTKRYRRWRLRVVVAHFIALLVFARLVWEILDSLGG